MNIKKIVSFLLFILIIMFFCTTYANSNKTIIDYNTNLSKYQKPATDTYKYFASSTITPSDFDPTTSQTEDNKKESKTVEIGNKIIGIVQAIGSIMSVISLILIGIKYMLGSAEEKAEYKSTMIPYLVGAILVFCASNIIAAIYNIMT